MASEDTRPFLDEQMSLSSRQSTQIGYERDSIDDLDQIDIEKMRQKEDHYTVLERDYPLGGLLAMCSSVKDASMKFRQYLLARKNYIYSALLLFAAGLFSVSLFGFLSSRSKALPPGRLSGFEYTSTGVLLSCGSNFEEAEAAGCTFDLMTFAWTPPACLDEEVYNDVLSDFSELAPTRGAGTWPWWRYENRTEPLEQNSGLKDYQGPWSNTYYHRAHCLYLWRIMHKAAGRVVAGEREVYVYSKAADWEHVVHCNKLMNDIDGMFSDYVRAMRVIGHCVRVDGVPGTEIVY
ncbi:uncharacterized protein LY89DRAFT_722071 [Mollisia scopiformis]|uniref:Uncharacterized protein n=1 Tax=Mollisia scopiformis TaxID=149040 RepID=A0A194WXP7_MOLSC|nr:uncharacterized protein LY89DRAFT_722071 [Mollisia scopiformis]KUJ12454.1 hypothetical protein LY89DRAFT_722071 [Mollisia scopiformis]